MATNILFNGNRIIFDGHADTPQECMAITAMCDSLAASEDFHTVVYEKGHAVFERVSGGESGMFQSLQEQIDALSAYVSTINSCKCDLEKYTLDVIGVLPEGKTLMEYIDEKIAAAGGSSAPEYKLPYTASELVEKLSAL